MNSKKQNEARFNYLIFGLFTLLLGLFTVYSSIGSMAINYCSSTHWESVPANISSLHLKKNAGKNSMRYQVEATYSYFYDGDRKSSNVTLNDFQIM